MEEDIDTILERRSKTLVHDGPRECDYLNPGSTFSMASFRSINRLTGDALVSAEEIDIDDPDFWKKVVGFSSCASASEQLTSSRRTNSVANYCMDLSGDDNGDSDSSVSEISDVGSISLELSELGFDTGLNLKNNAESTDPFLRYLQRSCSLIERRDWGGSSINDWERKDVLSILKYLQRFGYRTDVRNLIPQLSKQYDLDEVSPKECIKASSLSTYFHMIYSIDFEVEEDALVYMLIHNS
jgi:hypothetical protein